MWIGRDIESNQELCRQFSNVDSYYVDFFNFFIDLIKNINELTCVCMLSNYMHTHFCIKNEINAKNK